MKLSTIAYSIFGINIIGLIFVGIFMSWFLTGVCILPCCMVGYNAYKIKQKERLVKKLSQTGELQNE